jgi:hypothetical protein
MSDSINKLCPCKLGFSLGLVWGLAMLVLGLTTLWCGYGAAWVKLMSSIYIGFKPTVLGSFIGLLYGLVDFFVFGFIVAKIYNCCSAKSCCVKRDCS